MPLLTISHVTTYTYRQPVAFGEHRLMLRPRESFDQHLVAMELKITPEPTDVRWFQDVFGNSVAVATFARRAKSLKIESAVTVRHDPSEIETIYLEHYARTYPFTYSTEELPDLLRSIERQHHDPHRVIDAWAASFLDADGSTATLKLLSDMTVAIKEQFTYVPRAEQGTQTPLETLQRRQGTCRDYAMLMIEAVRSLGFAARFASGYVYSPHQHDRRIGGGNTHAWVRVYLPGSGWIEFDPTNGIVGNRGLVKVAQARDLYQAVPVSGTWSGFPGSFIDMDVAVSIDVMDTEASADVAEDTPVRKTA